MALKKITQEDYLLKTIEDMIKDLKMRRAEIIARMPQEEPVNLPSSWVGPTGRTIHIKGRKRA